MADTVGARYEVVSFGAEYLSQLRDGNPETNNQFAQFFGDLIVRYLRSRVRSAEAIEDIRQETLLRVLTALRSSERAIRRPERLIAYVLAVCNNVRREYCRSARRYCLQSDEHFSMAATGPDPEAILLAEELAGSVRKVLERIPAKERQALAMVFIEERERTDICGQLSVTDPYFRVALHRAKMQFRRRYRNHGRRREAVAA